jgi:hypothetical protein
MTVQFSLSISRSTVILLCTVLLSFQLHLNHCEEYNGVEKTLFAH